jgi:hypothetical protein
MRNDDAMTAARRCLMALALAVFALPATSLAQAPAKDAPKQVTYPLQLRDMVGVTNGKMVVVQGKTGARGHRFMIDKLWMTNPVSVTLMTDAKGGDLKLDLIKFPWAKPVRSAATGGSTRYVNEKFRTQGEFLIHVTSPVEDTPYQLVIWVGKEVVPDLPPVVVDHATYEAGLAKDTPASFPRWILAAALGGLLALVAIVILLRRRKS